MNNYPNIFDYATKEFTQDAMICWLLNCKETCLPFLNTFIFKNNAEIKGDIKFECEPKRQINRIDVYVNIEYNGRYYPIIFENKTNTTVHDKQIERYCEQVYKWFKDNSKLDKIFLVYFKTGYMFDKEKKLVEEEYNKIENKQNFCHKPIFISAEDMKGFIFTYKDKYYLLEDYYNYLEKLINEQKKYFEKWYEPDSLSKHIGQGRFFQELFGEDTDWLEANSGSVEYSYKNLIVYTDKDDKTLFTLLYRFEPRWKRKDKQNKQSNYVSQPYLQLQLYRNNKNYDKNNEWHEKVKKIANEIIEENSEWEIDFKTAKPPKNNYNGAEVFRITFSDDKNDSLHAQNVAKWLNQCSLKLQKVFSSEEVMQSLFDENSIKNVKAKIEK